jgi:hypothetical protein
MRMQCSSRRIGNSHIHAQYDHRNQMLSHASRRASSMRPSAAGIRAESITFHLVRHVLVTHALPRHKISQLVYHDPTIARRATWRRKRSCLHSYAYSAQAQPQPREPSHRLQHHAHHSSASTRTGRRFDTHSSNHKQECSGNVSSISLCKDNDKRSTIRGSAPPRACSAAGLLDQHSTMKSEA